MLKKALYIIGGLALGAVLLLPLFLVTSSAKDYLEAIAFVSFFVSLASLAIGFLLVFVSLGVKQVWPYTQASFIVGGVMMLLSFTLCSTGIVRFQL